MNFNEDQMKLLEDMERAFADEDDIDGEENKDAGQVAARRGSQHKVYDLIIEEVESPKNSARNHPIEEEKQEEDNDNLNR